MTKVATSRERVDVVAEFFQDMLLNVERLFICRMICIERIYMINKSTKTFLPKILSFFSPFCDGNNQGLMLYEFMCFFDSFSYKTHKRAFGKQC